MKIPAKDDRWVFGSVTRSHECAGAGPALRRGALSAVSIVAKPLFAHRWCIALQTSPTHLHT